MSSMVSLVQYGLHFHYSETSTNSPAGNKPTLCEKAVERDNTTWMMTLHYICLARR